MTLIEIKRAVAGGQAVYWCGKNYRVVRDALGEYLIRCTNNSDCVSLTWTDGETLNGAENEFFTA